MIYNNMKHLKTFESEEELYSDLINLGYDHKGYYITYITYGDGEMGGSSIVVIGAETDEMNAWESTCGLLLEYFGFDDFLGDESFKDVEELMDKITNLVGDMGNWGKMEYKIWELTPRGKKLEPFMDSEDILNPLECSEMGQRNFLDFTKTKNAPDYKS